MGVIGLPDYTQRHGNAQQAGGDSAEIEQGGAGAPSQPAACAVWHCMGNVFLSDKRYATTTPGDAPALRW
jgi:hypothetical protein